MNFAERAPPHSRMLRADNGRRSVSTLLAAGKYGESIPLPAPFGFSLPTDEWPAYPA